MGRLSERLAKLDDLEMPVGWGEVQRRMPAARLQGEELNNDAGRASRVMTALVALALFAVVSVFGWYAFRSVSSDDHAITARPSPGAVEGEALVEPMTEQERAEVFAFRAVAANGLMDPFGSRSYLFTYADDTTRIDGGWRVGFAASDCEPTTTGDGYAFTCQGLSGEDPQSGNALTDTFVTVALQSGRWVVVDVEGNMPAEDRDRLIGFGLPQVDEPSHWEFPAVGLWPGEEGTVAIDMVALWAGPYPTSASGSVCDVHAVDADGRILSTPRRFYEMPPDRPFERAGWVHATGVEQPADATRFVVECRQYTGPGWDVASDPVIVGAPGEVVAVSAELVWRGEEGFTSGARCTATIVDETGEMVWRGSTDLMPLWRPGELNQYPYRATVHILTREGPVDGHGIGDFSCDSI
jgi:hypothetical protein